MSQYPKNSTELGFLDLMWRYKFYVVFYIVAISCLSFAGLYLIGGVPEELKVLNPVPESLVMNSQAETPASVNGSTTAQQIATAPKAEELPSRIIIDKIGVDATVSNPSTANNDVLNNELLKGAVRYPGSGTLGKGNMFIFGHSTGLKIVNNQAFKTFNHLKDLNIGDTVRIQSNDTEYNYKVLSVTLVDSETELVDFSRTENMVTLSTCNVFGQKQERFVVQALFVKAVPLN